ncbi:metal ABC transporter substrate-binding protein [Sulfurimonas sp.]|uniref:metal ABC transporter substrate-binding protein n=1 Tax=Sulfurimonas sp. TaxID=2022749 RepID=UPI00356B2698
MIFKKIIITLFAAVLASLFVACSSEKKSDIKNTKINIVVSTYALYDITTHIAEDRFNVKNILPFGSDAHSYELSPKNMAGIQDANLFIYSGASLEPWAAKFSTQNSLDMSKYVKLIHLDEDDEHHHHKDSELEHEEKSEHKEALDPHYWLDLENMEKMTEVIVAEFIKLSPKDKEFFETNKKSYLASLAEMDNSYKSALKECKKDTIVVNHNAFSYLGKKYNFHIESINGLSNDSMPSPDDIKKILHLIEDEGISIIFFESFASDKIIKSIAKDTGVKVDTLQPLGNITKDEVGKSYKHIMDENIKKIKQALECK